MFHIEAKGIVSNKPEKEDLPNPKEVNFCTDILMLIKENKGFHHGGSSYGYKHILEKGYENRYISNGAFIKAAEDLKISIKRVSLDSPNAYFKFTAKDLKTALLTYLVSKEPLSISNDLVEKVCSQLAKYQTKTATLPIYRVQELYKNYLNIDITINDIIKIVKRTDLKIKYDFHANYINIENFGSKTAINVNLSKLIKILHNEREAKS